MRRARHANPRDEQRSSQRAYQEESKQCDGQGSRRAPSKNGPYGRYWTCTIHLVADNKSFSVAISVLDVDLDEAGSGDEDDDAEESSDPDDVDPLPANQDCDQFLEMAEKLIHGKLPSQIRVRSS